MAKAILEFDLNEPEDYHMHKRMMMADAMASAIWEITHNTKKGLEWAMDGKELNKYDALDMVYDKIHEILDQNNIDIDNIYQ